MTSPTASGALLITLTWLVVLSQAGLLHLESPDYDNNEIEANSHKSNPHPGLAAIPTLNSRILPNLPFGIPPGLSEDIPGAPLTREEFNFNFRDTLQDYIPDGTKNDPIELAQAFEGDIILSTPAEFLRMTQPGDDILTRNAVIQPEKIWPNAVIPYVISSTFDVVERGTIALGMRNFHENTCIKFVPRTTQKDYIHIYKGDGCSSSVGRLGGVQAVSLSDGCLYAGIVMHELMHAAGFWHEQSRFDRDQHVRIFWANIKNGLEYNFQKYNWNTISHLNTAYDPQSIMHYGKKSFAKDLRKNTIESLNGSPIGQRLGFSKLDVDKLNILYKCGKTSGTAVSPVTAGGSFGNAVCRDADKDCSYWAENGECTKNQQYMHLNCKSSCGLCRPANAAGSNGASSVLPVRRPAW